MANIVLIGGQWGDEGKGKVVDLLTRHFDVVARYSGGPNAGHTVRRGSARYALKHIPSGILTPGVACVIGNGMVIDPPALLKEIADLAEAGVQVAGRLWISDRAHLILPPYVAWETAREEDAAAARIGTTRRGVGPAYAAKTIRTGLRVVDLYDPEELPRRLAEASALYAAPGAVAAAAAPARADADLLEVCRAHAEALRPYVTDTAALLDERLRAGARVLFEGAQGTMLDLDHGTYPYVTSSSATAGGACTGLGISPTRVDGVLGVFKAYSSRVGEGPFPTEDHHEAGTLLRERGREYGTVTGRPRRTGWFDAVAAAYAARINGMDCAALTLLDVLDVFDEVRICVAYRHRGQPLKGFPSETRVLAGCEPEYKVMKGWRRETTGCRSFDDLPAEALDYARAIEDLIECDVDLVSVAPTPEGSVLREVSKLSAWLEG